MFFYRLKPPEAMKHLGVDRDTFALWCETVKIQSHQYEFSNRKYFNSGEFFAIADIIEINKIKEIHGDNWINVYKHADDVLPYLSGHKTIIIPEKSTYKPKSKNVSEFIRKLKK